jgi:hypothetical protein
LQEASTVWSDYLTNIETSKEAAVDYLNLDESVQTDEGIKYAQSIIEQYYKAAGTFNSTVISSLSGAIDNNEETFNKL